MTAEELEATYKVCNRKKDKLLQKVEPGKTPPVWINEEIKFIESTERLATMFYNLSRQYAKLSEAYDRLVSLFRSVENAFFAFVQFRHRFTWYGNFVSHHIHTLMVMNIFSMLPASDTHRRETLISLLNELIAGNIKTSSNGNPASRTADYTASESIHDQAAPDHAQNQDSAAGTDHKNSWIGVRGEG